MPIILLYIITQWYYCQQPHSELPGEKQQQQTNKYKKM